MIVETCISILLFIFMFIVFRLEINKIYQVDQNMQAGGTITTNTQTKDQINLLQGELDELINAYPKFVTEKNNKISLLKEDIEKKLTLYVKNINDQKIKNTILLELNNFIDFFKKKDKIINE